VHDYMSDAFDAHEEIAPDLDRFAFPDSISNEALLRARQVECGVDLERLDRGAEYQVELLDDIAATRRSLGV
ncbi:MAG: hypothetical protein JW990_09820, partial [Thermoleophilia bacterium]|nr:hypothetical protein [Thermoleophilia bacterium]